MECLTIVEVLVLALLVVVIASLLTCIAMGVYHLMVARKH
jgi:Tfp pilus assembly protein PilE